MGLGKTFVGSEKMKELGATVNLVVCQKSKLGDWIEHFKKYYAYVPGFVYDLTDVKQFEGFLEHTQAQGANVENAYGVINYDLVFRRPELLELDNFTLLLDESSLIQNETAKRTKFILKLKPANVILLSGTPTGGKYEKLHTQLMLLGWGISKKTYWNQFVNVRYLDNFLGRSIPIVTGYKNVDRLKRKMTQYGARFLKTSEVFDLPKQTLQTVRVETTKDYRTFRKEKIVLLDNGETITPLVGDTTLTKMLYERQLCGQYNPEKLKALRDLVESTEDRLVVFYNFNEELNALMQIANVCERPFGAVNGTTKNPEILAAESAILFVQYQAGAMGLNLQAANKIIYFTPPLSSELFEQSKKRIHRIGQENPCFYYLLTCKNSVEERIYKALEMRRDYTERLFENERNI